jgi:hypothetical protein
LFQTKVAAGSAFKSGKGHRGFVHDAVSSIGPPMMSLG